MKNELGTTNGCITKNVLVTGHEEVTRNDEVPRDDAQVLEKELVAKNV